MVLRDRPCKIGGSLNVRTEKQGEDSVPAVDIPIEGFLLEKREVDALVDGGYWNSIFEQRITSDVPTRAFPAIKGHTLEGKYEAAVTLAFGPNQQDLILEEVNVARIYLEPLEGGLVAMSLVVHANQAVEKFTGKLTARLGSEVNVQIELGDKVERAKSKQQELPINTFGEGEAPDVKPRAH